MKTLWPLPSEYIQNLVTSYHLHSYHLAQATIISCLNLYNSLLPGSLAPSLPCLSHPPVPSEWQQPPCPFPTRVRSCPSSAQHPPVAPHLTKNKSQGPRSGLQGPIWFGPPNPSFHPLLLPASPLTSPSTLAGLDQARHTPASGLLTGCPISQDCSSFGINTSTLLASSPFQPLFKHLFLSEANSYPPI